MNNLPNPGDSKRMCPGTSFLLLFRLNPIILVGIVHYRNAEQNP